MHVTVVKRLERPFVMAYRTGETMAAMLRLCAEPRTVAEVIAVAGAGNEQRAAQALQKSLSNGVLARCGSAR